MIGSGLDWIQFAAPHNFMTRPLAVISTEINVLGQCRRRLPRSPFSFAYNFGKHRDFAKGGPPSSPAGSGTPREKRLLLKGYADA